MDRSNGKIGKIVGSRSLNLKAEDFSLFGLNKTQAGGLVHMM
jgi:hypothetical protein